ncbi:unnamed protein product [marine sediment metagenome]|uniref:Uncharacterized protein n=1 Tax=marine sediment metagenome TaxID=412755 RepID=X0RWK6_9ZZZZ
MTDDSNTKSDPLDTKTVVGECDENSKKGQARRDTHRAALDAQEKGELDGMFAAYRTAVEQRAEAESLWLKALSALGDVSTKELTQANPVEAIRDVALAAIQLAKDVALSNQAEEKR